MGESHSYKKHSRLHDDSDRVVSYIIVTCKFSPGSVLKIYN